MYPSLAEPRGGKDQAPILTKWWRELVPAVLVEPVEEVELFLHSSTWSPKSRNPQHEVFCRAPPPLPGRNRSYCHPALMPALLLSFSRNTRAQLIPAPQSRLDGLSPVSCTAPSSSSQRGASPAGKRNQLFRGYLAAKGCWS